MDRTTFADHAPTPDVLTLELHCHSEHSHDGVDPVEEMLARAEAVGLDGIVVTDHDTIDGSLEAIDRADAYDLVALTGTEVSSAAGHVLGIGVDDDIPRGLPFEETVERIHGAGGIAVVPHPCQTLRKGVLANEAVDPADLTVADAIETYNSRFLTGRTNRQAARLADRLGMPATAGSDAHVAEMVGKATTRVDAEPEPDAITTAIREGQTGIDGGRTPLWVTLRQAAGTARRRARRVTR